MNQDWASETIRVLASVVRMIPVGARLVDLSHDSVSAYLGVPIRSVNTVKT